MLLYLNYIWPGEVGGFWVSGVGAGAGLMLGSGPAMVDEVEAGCAVIGFDVGVGIGIVPDGGVPTGNSGSSTGPKISSTESSFS